MTLVIVVVMVVELTDEGEYTDEDMEEWLLISNKFEVLLFAVKLRGFNIR